MPERRSLGRDSTWLAEWWRRGMKENQCMVVKDKQIILWSWRGNVEMWQEKGRNTGWGHVEKSLEGDREESELCFANHRNY